MLDDIATRNVRDSLDQVTSREAEAVQEAVSSMRARDVCPNRLARLLGVLLLVTCSACGPTPKTSVYRLPSGRHVDVFHAGVLVGEWTLMYKTQLQLTREYMIAHSRLKHRRMPRHLHSMHYALQCEAAGLQGDSQLEAEANGVEMVAIEPVTTEREFLGFDRFQPTWSEGDRVTFRLEQDAGGIWRRTAGWIAGPCGDEAVEQRDRADGTETLGKF